MRTQTLISSETVSQSDARIQYLEETIEDAIEYLRECTNPAKSDVKYLINIILKPALEEI